MDFFNNVDLNNAKSVIASRMILLNTLVYVIIVEILQKNTEITICFELLMK